MAPMREAIVRKARETELDALRAQLFARIGQLRDGLGGLPWRLLPSLTAERLSQMVELASIPEEIRGYGHVKERHVKTARAKGDALMAAWRAA